MTNDARHDEASDGPGERLRILSSAHLATGPHAELSELEFGLIIAHNAFSRWVVRCMAAAGVTDLAVTDVLVLHHVHHRERGKKLADICFTLNYEDTHVINYSLKKLAGLGLVRGEKLGKEVFYATTAEGAALIDRFRAVRGRCLLASVEGELADGASLSDVARRLRMLSGLYDQAARAASSL
ncbi:winged helix DNA-binding protein [Pigmentiphaga sp.]|uniref:winged helix DNA-binding protein n=1 Tax=Pigmentiphaga sp. TaxID=1977564 RepID=UPI00128E08DA|nr:winged helix DNA-binding protein [Pigmentiphaga sp.]MPS26719.1 transcriptional regulator [Alcaligenaceae bacterium SAGV5]MPS53745.1 transcriptional regulator [Alcaligenaceae bacterium SAGV3]MPT59943.1 transcriptional regulator [Alcaligenaceae bacterium]